ncbi:MAG: endonuclease/exonuclease/phosphatase family protein [Actinomycetia bacterium]|nr:endonuclease/exonuclease/phosphatase family protein [Actinomycetes bacterium]MCP4228100.1 endonuclease/exonuclease/phosphatase family protein [Actinomycetes bacterium]MCP5031689.1 endonuclease/exonuclease/phosphatase family protein [Actinomycetes bacterium]
MTNLHLSAPLSADLAMRRHAEYRQLTELDAATHVVAGDFNSTLSHVDFRTFVHRIGHDAHRRAGCGPGLRWSPLTDVELLAVCWPLDGGVTMTKVVILAPQPILY